MDSQLAVLRQVPEIINAYSTYLMNPLLRKACRYDGFPLLPGWLTWPLAVLRLELLRDNDATPFEGSRQVIDKGR